MRIFLPLFVFILFATTNPACAQEPDETQDYEVPPSSSTSTDVPSISDEAMKACVKLYNEAKWLAEEIEDTQVDQYSRKSVNAYNKKVNQHSGMIDQFNRECAGKQSDAAARAARELNERSGNE